MFMWILNYGPSTWNKTVNNLDKVPTLLKLMVLSGRYIIKTGNTVKVWKMLLKQLQGNSLKNGT